jgi:hypothetical protein
MQTNREINKAALIRCFLFFNKKMIRSIIPVMTETTIPVEDWEITRKTINQEKTMKSAVLSLQV